MIDSPINSLSSIYNPFSPIRQRIQRYYILSKLIPFVEFVESEETRRIICHLAILHLKSKSETRGAFPARLLGHLLIVLVAVPGVQVSGTTTGRFYGC
jgi:hypothetical protein